MLILNIHVDLTNQLNGIEFIGRLSKTIITLTPVITILRWRTSNQKRGLESEQSDRCLYPGAYSLYRLLIVILIKFSKRGYTMF